MIRIDRLWLAVEPLDMRAGAERLLARVVQVFGSARAQEKVRRADFVVRTDVPLAETRAAVLTIYQAILQSAETPI